MASPSGKSILASSADSTTEFFVDRAVCGFPSANGKEKKSKKFLLAAAVDTFISTSAWLTTLAPEIRVLPSFLAKKVHDSLISGNFSYSPETSYNAVISSEL